MVESSWQISSLWVDLLHSRSSRKLNGEGVVEKLEVSNRSKGTEARESKQG